jgi:predicted ATP-dependent serine protease
VRAVRASSVATTSSARRVKTDGDTDRATGGGFVLGSAWLLSGFAGSGKSTGALRWSRKIARATSRPILYGSAEMAPDLVRAMATRLELDLDQLWILATEDLHALCVEAVELRPCAVVLDSVARFCVAGGDPGTPTAMVGTVQASIHLARQIDAVAFAIAHATTEGTVKGPTDLEHDVDVAAWVRDDGIAEITKNRWGATPAEIIARRQ